MLPLKGVKVLDFTQAAAGPFCGMLLGSMGADVVKIEPLWGDHFRPFFGGAWSSAINLNKRSLSVNLKDPRGKEIVLRMVKSADVFLEAFVPGIMEKLGLGYNSICDINPKIIYCSVSGYGQNGPYRNRPGYDVCAQCESGLIAATGEEDGPYVRIGSSLVDYGTGMYAAYGIALALLHRKESNEGQHIDVSLISTAISWMNYWITNYSLTGKNPPRAGSGHAFAVPYQIFETKDRPVFIGILTDKFWKGFCEVLNLNSLFGDPRFATNNGRIKHKAVLVPLLQRELKKHSSSWLIEKLNRQGIPSASVNTVGEVVVDQHIIDQHMIKKIDDPLLGTIEVINVPLRLSKSPGSIHSPSPILGQHTREVLIETGFSDEDIDLLIKNNVVLQNKESKGFK